MSGEEVPASDLPSIAGPSPAGMPVPDSDLPTNYGSGTEMLKTAIEQGLSGATLGLSKVAETKLLGVDPAAIAGREAANPVTSTLSNIGGGAATILATGGAGGLAKGAGLAAKVGVGAIEGAGFGGINQATDDWSQNKALDAQRIAASAGLGALIGGTASGIVGWLSPEASRAAQTAAKTADDAGLPPPPGSAPSAGIDGASPVVQAGEPPSSQSSVADAPKQTFKGVQPTDLDTMAKAVEDSKYDGTAHNLPQQGVLLDAASQIETPYPINPAQVDSLSSQGKRNLYQIAKDTPDENGATISQYEGLQKQDWENQAQKTIESIAPDTELAASPREAGERVAEDLSDTIQNQRSTLGKAIGEIKGTAVDDVDHLNGVVEYLVKDNPKIANMFHFGGEELEIEPSWDPQMGITKTTYENIKSMIESIKKNNPDVEGLFNLRESLDEGVNLTNKDKSANQLIGAKKAMMSYIQDAVQSAAPDTPVRQIFADYAKASEAANFIERRFGAKIGDSDWRSLANNKPEEKILGKMFGDSATTRAAKNIMAPDKFNAAVANWINQAKASFTTNGVFSSNNFGRWLAKNASALEVALEDQPAMLRRLQALTTMMRIVPDAPPVVVGSGKTILESLRRANLHHMTWEGMLAKIPEKILEKISETQQTRALNASLAGTKAANAADAALQGGAAKTSNRINRGVKALFSGAAGMSRKLH